MTLKRILFIYAKLNPRVSYVQHRLWNLLACALQKPGILCIKQVGSASSLDLRGLRYKHLCHRYVQGMNEILAPIYYVIAQDPAFSLSARAKKARHEASAPKFGEAGESDQQPDETLDCNDSCTKNDADGTSEEPEGVTQELLDRWAEADTFNCFSNIMVEVCDLFTREMDSGSSGITGQLKNFDEIFHRACPSLAAHFDSLKVRLPSRIHRSQVSCALMVTNMHDCAVPYRWSLSFMHSVG